MEVKNGLERREGRQMVTGLNVGKSGLGQLSWQALGALGPLQLKHRVLATLKAVAVGIDK